VKIRKNSKVLVKNQIIAVTAREDIMEYEFFPNYSKPEISVNPTSQITTLMT